MPRLGRGTSFLAWVAQAFAKYPLLAFTVVFFFFFFGRVGGVKYLVFW